MRYRELVKRLKRLECELIRQAGGSHEIWHNPHTGGISVIPCHGREISKKTLGKILRKLGLEHKDPWGV